MNNPEITIVDSILEVKASGIDLNIQHDLSLSEGKSIAQLLYDQEKTNQVENKDQSAQ